MPTLKTRILVPALAVALMTGTSAAPATAAPVAPQHAKHGHGHGHGKGPKERIDKNVTIKRDNYGVPHVYAKTIGGLYTGYGYAVAQDRMFQMEMAKRSVLGTSAEVIGESGVENDKRSRATLDPESIQQQIDQLSEDDRSVLRGYARGYNKYVDKVLADQTSLLPKQFNDFGFKPSHFTEYDVAMIWIGTMANRFSDSTSEVENLKVKNQLIAEHGDEKGTQLFEQLLWTEDPSAPTTVPRSESASMQSSGSSALAPIDPSVQDSSADTAEAFGGQGWPHAAPEASNIWMVGKEKSTDGGSTLLNGPQFDWFNPSYVYGIGLHGAGIDVTGNTPFAYPSILFGTNKDIAWGSTAGPLDVNDVYQEDLNPENHKQYMFNGQYRDMEERTEQIAVKDSAPVDFTVQSTVHGTVTATDPQNNSAYSKKRAWKGTEVQSLMAWVNIMKAKNWDEYLAEAEKVGITINWYYADKGGNIGYVTPGKLPVRPENQDFRVPAKGDGSMEWQGFRPFEDNPKTYNPEQGYVANWNNQAAPGFNSDTGNWSSVDRFNEITSRLESQEKFTPQEVWDINKETSFADLNIRYLRPHLESAVEYVSANDQLRSDANILLEWDGQTVDEDKDGNYDGAGPTIMRSWLPKLSEAVLKDDLPQEVYDQYAASIYRKPGGSARPAETTKLLSNALAGEDSAVPQSVDFFNGEDHGEVLRDTFKAATDELREKHGNDPASWTTPVIPHEYKTKNFMGIPQADPSETLSTHQYMNRGTENNLIHLNPKGASMCVAAPPGQSGFIAPDGTKSPHYQDQLELYTNFECKEENLHKNQVARNLESVTNVK